MFLFFIFFSFLSYSQDTVFYEKNFTVMNNNLIIEKNFRGSKNWVKIVYQYSPDGVLLRRYWYNKNGELLSISLDN
jgi:hypothetical protein